MKKCIILGLLLLIVGSIYAQDAPREALQSLEAAKTFIQKGDYAKAQEELNFTQGKLNELIAGDLLKYIPETPKGFNFLKKETSSLGQSAGIVGNSSIAIGYFSKGNSNFEMHISKGGALGQAGGIVSGLATMFGGMGGDGMRQIRISGYTGTLEYDAQNLSGSLTIPVGAAITVIVSGEDLKSPDQLKELAEQIDFTALAKSN